MGGLQSILVSHRAALARYLRARIRCDGDVEDILQDLWLKTSSLETGPVAEPLAYLYRMAENLVRDRARSSVRRHMREAEWTTGEIDGTVDAAVDSQPTAERILLARDHLNRVDARIDALPDRASQIFRLVRIEGTPQKEVAATLGISLSAVEKHLQRAYRAVIEAQAELDAGRDHRQRH